MRRLAAAPADGGQTGGGLAETGLVGPAVGRQHWADQVGVAERGVEGDLLLERAFQPGERDMGAGDGQPELIEEALQVWRGQPAVTGQFDGRIADGGHLAQRADEVLLRRLADGVELQGDPWARHGGSSHS